MNNNINSVGRHYTFDIYNCRTDKLEYSKNIEVILNKIVAVLKLTKVGESYKQFEPVGVTGFILLEESHVSIHSWPEHKFAALDVFSCRSCLDIDKIKNLLKIEFDTDDIEIRSIMRGTLLTKELV